MKFQEIFEQAKPVNFLRGPGVKHFARKLEEIGGKVFSTHAVKFSVWDIENFVGDCDYVCIYNPFDDCGRRFDLFAEALSILKEVCDKGRKIFLVSSNQDFVRLARIKVKSMLDFGVEEFYITDPGEVFTIEDFQDPDLCRDLLDFVYNLQSNFRNNYFNGDTYKDHLEIEKKVDNFLAERNFL